MRSFHGGVVKSVEGAQNHGQEQRQHDDAAHGSARDDKQNADPAR
jgi:hypothetical protein